jgi:4-hydroxy-3-polyprenylbenzoate decarboxylase
MNHPIVLAMTGASGAAYAARLLQQLVIAERNVHIVWSPSAATVVAQELSVQISNDPKSVNELLNYRWPGLESHWGDATDLSQLISPEQLVVHHYQDYMTPIASGSFLTAGMVLCPCSGATLSGVVHAAGNNLIQRAADVHLKERRKLILVPRETPMSVFQLENMHRAAQAGAIVLPAMPGWYHDVRSVVDLIDFIVARILDHLDVPHRLMQRWGDES